MSGTQRAVEWETIDFGVGRENHRVAPEKSARTLDVRSATEVGEGPGETHGKHFCEPLRPVGSNSVSVFSRLERGGREIWRAFDKR